LCIRPTTRVGPASRCDERIQGASGWSITLPAIIVRVSPLQTQVKRAQSLNRCGLPSEGAAITTEEAPETSTEDASQERPAHRVRETVVLIVLSITAVLTAWCGFESAKWSGEMSVAFSEASSSRIEAARQSGVANAARQADLSVWGVYLQARAQGDTALATFVEKRFSDHFRVAYQAWINTGEATSGPFKMKEYVPPGTTEAAAADQRADSRFADALVFNQSGDNYALLTVLYALVLFFAAASTRLGRSNAQWILIGVAITFLTAATVILATFPIKV
jgi:hypothetical protein